MTVTNVKFANLSLRGKRLILLSAGFVIVLLSYATWHSLTKAYESTEDAYLAGDQIPITARVSGSINFIAKDNTEWVEAGEVLFRLDPKDYQLALHTAEQNLISNLKLAQQEFLQVEASQFLVEQAKTLYIGAEQDLAARKRLIAQKLVSQEDINHFQNSFDNAYASYQVAKKNYELAAAKVEAIGLEQHPLWLNGINNYQQAYYNWRRTEVRAPVAGMLVGRQTQIGQMVSAGSPLTYLVPLDRAWIEANFKESQIQGIKPGQAVKIKLDAFDDIDLVGRVIGIGAGTGSVFSALPAQNASGNWIKVVQRLPTKIQLDWCGVDHRKLRLGLSSQVTVDTSSPIQLPKPSKPYSYIEDTDEQVMQNKIQGIFNLHQLKKL